MPRTNASIRGRWLLIDPANVPGATVLGLINSGTFPFKDLNFLHNNVWSHEVLPGSQRSSVAVVSTSS